MSNVMLLTILMFWTLQELIQPASNNTVEALSFFPPSSMRQPKRMVLLDRDGVINEDVGPPGVLSPQNLRLTPHAAESIARLKANGWIVVIVTNQSCVGKELITVDELTKIHEHLQTTQLLPLNAELDRIYYCADAADTLRYKPAPGMLLEALRDYNIDPKNAIMIGDTFNDIRAATGAEISTKILVSTGYGSRLMGRAPSLKTTEEKHCQLVECTDGKDMIDCSDAVPRSICPFLYTESLATAVEWILTKGRNQLQE